MLNWESEMSVDSGWVSGWTAEGGGGHTEELIGVDALQDFDFLGLLFGRHGGGGGRVWTEGLYVLCLYLYLYLYGTRMVSVWCCICICIVSVSASSPSVRGRVVFGGVASCGADLGWFGLGRGGEQGKGGRLL